jgi:hypothetical protein
MFLVPLTSKQNKLDRLSLPGLLHFYDENNTKAFMSTQLSSLGNILPSLAECIHFNGLDNN